ncbi:MAG: hypothetical protein IJQ50_03955 [Clostridia bacterium]|nr:hypothetical protein [Clostridia bacterium]
MKISNPELKVIRFGADDVIATSGLTGMTGQFYIPASQYSGGSFTSDYVRFDGTFGAYNGSAYEITGIYGVEGDDENDREGMMAQGGHYFPGPGVFVPPWDLSPIAKQTYDAYSYDGGTYYSNGVSYYETYFQ